MVLAAYNDGAFHVVYLLHIVAVIMGTGAAFLAPVLTAKVGKTGQSADSIDAALSAVIAPALLLAGIFGGALVGMSDSFYDFGQSWLGIAGVLWLVMVVAAAFVYPPSYINLPDLSDKRAMLGGILHLSLTGMLIIMTWKPGSPF
jgi:hypothetical protein